MPKICVLQPPGKEATYVNPMLVTMLHDGNGYTRLEFEKGHAVNVDLPIEQVRRLLDVALNADQP